MNIITNKPNHESKSICNRLVKLTHSLNEICTDWWSNQELKTSILHSHRVLFTLHRELKLSGDKRWRSVEKAARDFSLGSAKLSQACAQMSKELGQEGEVLLGRAAKELLLMTRS